MNRSAAILFALFCSCSVKVQEKELQADSTDVALDEDTVIQAVDELHDSDYGIYHFTFSVSKSLPQHSLKFHLPDRKIYVYSNPKEEGQPITEVPISEEVNFDEGYFAENIEETFSFADYNFDGYRDIVVLKMSGTSNSWSDIYLFDPARRTFQRHDVLSELPTLDVDSANRVVKYYNNGGMAGAWYNYGVVQWRNNQPVTILEEEQTSDENDREVFIRTISVLDDNGRMVTASRVRISQPEAGTEKHCLLEGEWTEFDKRPNLLFADSDESVIRTDGRDGSCN